MPSTPAGPTPQATDITELRYISSNVKANCSWKIWYKPYLFQIDGCVDINYKIKTNILQKIPQGRLAFLIFGVAMLRIDASVTEDATDITLNETAVTSRFEFHDIKLKVVAPKYFKPGFPFYAKV